MSKIAIIGSHGVGKTTLIQRLKLLYPELNFIDEVARDLQLKYGKSTRDMNDEEKSAFQLEAMETQINQEKKYDSYISDHSAISYLPYSTELPVYNELKAQIRDQYLPILKELKIIYIPIEFGLENDGLRFATNEYQKYIDETLVDLMHKYNLKYITITGTVEERLNQISKVINPTKQ
jgi:nicotinamide riboside kinase